MKANEGWTEDRLIQVLQGAGFDIEKDGEEIVVRQRTDVMVLKVMPRSGQIVSVDRFPSCSAGALDFRKKVEALLFP